MTVYRITSCTYVNDLSGKGAALYGGRWNNKDTYMVYTAQSRALALLEAVMHMGKVPVIGYCMATIDIPGDSIQILSVSQLPQGWDSNPGPDYLRTIGDDFIKSNQYLALQIPSALMMEDYNYLINPAHPLFDKVQVTSHRPISFDERLFPSSPHRA